MTTSTSSKRFWGLLGLLFLAAAGLRFWNLGLASIQVDEVATLLRAGQWRTRPHEDVHPPLFFALVELWTYGGLSEAWLRSLSVLASLVALVLWALLLPRTALLGGVAMLALSFADVQQSRELRMYSWLQLWALLYFWCMTRQRWALAALGLLCASFTHLFGLFLIPVGWFVEGFRPRALAYQGLVLALWLSWGIPHYLAQAQHPLDLRQRPSLSMGLEAVGRLLGGRVAAFGDTLSLALGAIVLAWLLFSRPRVARWVYAWALIPWLSIWLVSRYTPLQLFEFKYLVWTLPAWIWLLLAGRRPAWILLPLVLVNLAWMLPWLYAPHDYQANWRRVANMLDGEKSTIVVHPSMMAGPLLYYGYAVPPLRPLDEWSQLQPGRPMVWVTTPHHPYVGHQRLLQGVRRYWRMDKEVTLPSRLPSSQVDLSWWSWTGEEGSSQAR